MTIFPWTEFNDDHDRNAVANDFVCARNDEKRSEEMLDEQQVKCKSCGTVLQGDYCHACGEKQLTSADKSAKKWLGDVFANIWMLDGKLIRTVKVLVLRPWQLAKDFINGRRKPYVKPLNIFLIANLLYFLSPSFDTFKTTLNSQMHHHPYSPLIESFMESRFESGGYTYESIQADYDKKTNEVSKLIIITLAPLLGFLIYGLFYRQGLYLSDGFNLGFQFWAFFMLIFMVVLPALSRFIYRLTEFQFFTGEITVSGAAFTISGLYLFFQLRSWTGEKKWLYFLKIFVMVVAFLPLIMVYRFILFWITFLLL